MHDRELLAACQDRLDSLNLPSPYGMWQLREAVARRRGKRIELQPQGAARDEGLPCGMRVETPQAEIVFFERGNSPVHRLHILAHELSHILCGHPSTLTPSAGGYFRLNPVLARRMSGRIHYTTACEREAEMMATVIRQRIHQGEELPSAPSRCRHSGSEWHTPARLPCPGAAIAGLLASATPGPASTRSPHGARAGRARARSQRERAEWENRMLRQLTPLWAALTADRPDLVLLTDDAGIGADFLLYRRVIEINDAVLALRPYRSLEMQALAQRAADRLELDNDALDRGYDQAFTEAVVLQDAVAAHRVERRPADPAPLPPGTHDRKPTLHAEAEWLGAVAALYAMPPTALSALTFGRTEARQ